MCRMVGDQMVERKIYKENKCFYMLNMFKNAYSNPFSRNNDCFFCPQ